MKFFKTYSFPIILIITLYVVHLTVKDFSSPYEKPIVGDAKAYYAYLPAIFIYQDSQYGFVDDYEEKYYAKNQKKDFLNVTENGEKVNKTFPGAAILYLPFFLIAHGLALLFGAEADGYSLVYQYLFDFGYWFYLFLGALFFVKTFKLLNFKSSHIYAALTVIILGTNVLFYSVVDQSVTHIFNFAMINAMLYFLIKYKQIQQFKYVLVVVTLLLLIGITRPTNILVLLLVPIFISDKSFYTNLFKTIFKLKHFSILLIVTLVIGSIPFLLWQWQTGNWVVYSYGDEGFDFSNPEIFNFLWSYTKGWFVYTPIALFVLIFGLFHQLKESKLKAGLIVLFYALSVYVFSSWWCWYYGAGMSQRVMIDHYILLGYLLLITIRALKPIYVKLGACLMGLLIVVNIIQTAQIKKGIYKMGSPTKEMYWDNFLSLNLKAKVYEKSNWELLEAIHIDLESSEFIVKGQSKKDDQKHFLQTNELETYSPTIQVKLNKPTKKIVVGWVALAQNEIKNSQLVLNTISDSPETKVVYLNAFMIKNKATRMEFVVEFNQPTTQFNAYFWNGNTSELVDYYNLTVESYE